MEKKTISELVAQFLDKQRWIQRFCDQGFVQVGVYYMTLERIFEKIHGWRDSWDFLNYVLQIGRMVDSELNEIMREERMC